MLFLVYASIKMTSHLSPEEYLAKLAPVVQSPRPYEGAVRPKPDNDSMIFQGRVIGDRFSLMRLEGQSRGGRQAPPPQIKGVLRQAGGGTAVSIQIFPDCGAIVGSIIATLFWGYIALDSAPFSAHGVLQPTPNSFIFFPFLLLIYLTVLFAPVRDEYQAIGMTLTQVIEDRPVPVKVMLR